MVNNIPPISKHWTTTSHHKQLITKKTTIYDIGNSDSGLGQEQICGGVKWDNGEPNLYNIGVITNWQQWRKIQEIFYFNKNTMNCQLELSPIVHVLIYYSGQTESSTEFDSKGKRNLWTRTHLTREDILQAKNIKKKPILI